MNDDGLALQGVGVNGADEVLGVRLLAGEELGAVALPAELHPLRTPAAYALASHSWQRYSNPGPLVLYIANNLTSIDVRAALTMRITCCCTCATAQNLLPLIGDMPAVQRLIKQSMISSVVSGI